MLSRVSHRYFVLFSLPMVLLAAFQIAATGQPNAIQLENARQGTNVWKLSNPAENQEIEGYASATSVNRGDSIGFFVRTTSPTFTLAIYRLGWYGCLGGRDELAPVELPG